MTSKRSAQHRQLSGMNSQIRSVKLSLIQMDKEVSATDTAKWYFSEVLVSLTNAVNYLEEIERQWKPKK